MSAVYPPLFYWSARLNTEIPFTTLLTAAMLFLARGVRLASSRNLAIAGLCLGLACLARPAGVFVLALVPVWAFLSASRVRISRTVLSRTLLVVIPALLVIAPWTVRNARSTGHFVFLSTLGGNVLLGSHNPAVAHAPPEVRGAAGWSRGGWVPPEESGLLSPHDLARVETLSEVDRDRLYRNRAITWMRANPREIPPLLFHKMLRLFELVPPETGLRGLLSLLPYYAVLALAIAGAWMNRRAWHAHLPLSLAIVSTIASAAVTWGGRRFRHPMEPALLLLAAAGLVWLRDRVTSRRAVC